MKQIEEVKKSIYRIGRSIKLPVDSYLFDKEADVVADEAEKREVSLRESFNKEKELFKREVGLYKSQILKREEKIADLKKEKGDLNAKVFSLKNKVEELRRRLVLYWKGII